MVVVVVVLVVDVVGFIVVVGVVGDVVVFRLLVVDGNCVLVRTAASSTIEKKTAQRKK